MEKARQKLLRLDQRTLSSEQQPEEPAPIVAAESPHVEPPPRIPETADVVIMGKMHLGASQLRHLYPHIIMNRITQKWRLSAFGNIRIRNFSTCCINFGFLLLVYMIPGRRQIIEGIHNK